ncbi:MAG: hypothetical protein GY953_51290, partial [bacterium]|nr:hypothetical protein [bacterium]
VADGALVAEADSRFPARTAHLLTYELVDEAEPLRLAVRISAPSHSERAGFAGFLIGAGAGRLDYRGAALVHHFPGKGGGILAVAEPDGLAFRDMSAETNAADYPLLNRTQKALAGGFVLNLEGVPAGAGKYSLRLWAWDGATLLAATELSEVDGSRLLGNVALVSHNGGKRVTHRFEDFRVGGGRLAHHPERTFGPIAGTLYTVSGDTLKLSAQFLPLSSRVALPASQPGQRATRLQAHLERKTSTGWETIAGPKPVAGPDYYVPFRVDGWDASRDRETRVVFEDIGGKLYHYTTRVTRDPVEKSTVSVAGFT